MSEKILEAFKKLKIELDKRDYDDERFIKDLPENEPVSLVIPFEQTARGYLDIFRSYIGGDKHPELSDEELLENYLKMPENKIWIKDIETYTPKTFRGTIELVESTGTQKTRFSSEKVKQLIDNLQKQGINAVSKQDEKSQDPSTVVVINNGIITPFMSKEEIQSLIPKIKKIMSNSHFSVGGHISPITIEQLRTPQQWQNPEDLPFMQNFMKEFLEQPSSDISSIKDLNALTASSGKIRMSADRHELLAMDKKNDQAGRPYVWRGGVLGEKAFVANINTTSLTEPHVLRKSWAMATPSIRYAADYATRNPELAFMDKKDGIGFLYQYSTTETEEYFPDRGIERQPDPGCISNREELPVFPSKHLLKNIFFCYANGDEGYYLMRLDRNNPIHQQLLKLYEPKETRVAGHLLQRRVNQFNEASANDGHPKAYNPIISRTEKEHTSLLQTLSACAVKEKTEPVKNNEVSATQNAIRVAKQSQH